MDNSAAAETSGQMPLLNRNYILMVFVNICLSIAFYFFQPILASYITSLGISVAIAGIVAGLFSITALVARPFTGLLADRISPKVVLMIALPLEAVFGAGYGLIPSLPWIVTCRVIHAVGFALASTVTLVYGSFFIPKERMGEGIGWLGMGVVLGTAIGPTVGLTIAEKLSFKATFLIGGAIFMIGFILLLMTRPPKSVTEKPKEKRSIRLSDMLSLKLFPLSFMAGLLALANGFCTAFLALHAASRGIEHVGLYFTIMAIALVVTRPLAGKIVDKKGLSVIAIPCFIVCALGLFLISRANSFGYLALAGVLGAGQGTGMTAIQTTCVRSLPDAQRGVASSTYYVFSDVFQGLGPMFGGRFAELTSPGQTVTYVPLYTLGSGILIFGLIIYIIYASIRKKQGQPL